MKKLSKRTLAILIVFCFFISFLTPIVDFAKLNFKLVNPKTSTNYLFKDTPYNITLNDVFDDSDPYKLYTASYFQSQYKNDSTDLWEDVHNETTDSGTDNNEVGYGSPSGHFEATYSFVGETGLTGTQISFVDYESIISNGGILEVIDNLDGHSEVIYAKPHITWNGFGNQFSAKEFGTVEFWVRSGQTNLRWELRLQQDYTIFGEITFGADSKITWYNGTSYVIYTYSANTWYHIRLDFNCTSDSMEVYVNGVYEFYAIFQNDLDYINKFQFNSHNQIDPVFYIDAVGYKTGDYQSTESFDYTTEEGVYYGTYDFRDDSIGSVPSGWVKTGTIDASVVSDYYGHKKVLKMNITVLSTNLQNTFSSTRTGTNTIEFWVCRANLNNQQIIYFLGTTGSSVSIFFNSGGGCTYYKQGGTFPLFFTMVANTWYHFRVQINVDASPDVLSIWVDGVLKVDSQNSYYDRTNLYYLRILAGNAVPTLFYWDAFGYTWDTTSHSNVGYKVGFNINPYDIIPFFNFVAENYGSPYIKCGNSMQITNLDGHQKVLQMTRGTTSLELQWYHDYFLNQYYGTYEFWWRCTDATKDLMLTMFTEAWGVGVQIKFGESNKIRHYDGAWKDIVAINSNQWYHIRIDFETGAGGYQGLAADKFHVYIGGIHYGDYSFKDVGNKIDFIRWYIYETDPSCSHYFDAIGYSWDSGYTVGDNYYPYDPDYEIGDNLYPDNINMIKGKYDYTDNMLTLNAVLTSFTSTHTEGTRYDSPAQFGDFTFTKGSSGVTGELETNNGVNYATLISSAPTFYPLSAEYIDDVTYTYGSGSGSLSSTQVDDTNYYQLSSVESYPFHVIDATLVFIPALAGRDFYVSVHIESTITMTFLGEGGTTFDYDNVIKEDLTTIKIFTLGDYPHNVKIYYLKLNEVGVTPAELDISATWTIPDSILTFFYDYRTNVSVDCDLDIYNWDTTGWLELKSAISTSFQTGNYALTDPYISSSNQVKIRFQTATYGGWFKIELDQLTVSYIDDPAELEFSILTPFLKYNRDLLSIHIESHQKTNISQQIYFKIWNYDTSSYDTITSATETTTVTKREFNSITPDKYISSNGVKLYWTGINSEDDFIFSIDYLFIRITYKMNIWHEVSFNQTGLWRYRWELHGSLQYTDWTQFEVVDPIPNFHAVSESDVTTRWILQGADISPVENFSDDISGSNWLLTETGDPIIDTNNILTDDSYVEEYYPNTNYGSGNTLFVDYYIAYNVWSYIKYVYPYLDLNITSNSSLYCYVLLSGGEFYMYNTSDFSESTITWNNKPSLDTYQNYLSTGSSGYNLFDIGYPSYCYALVSKDGDENFDISIYSSEHTNKPYVRHHFSKVYQGDGYMYMQTDTTELIALRSEDYGTHYTLSSGDYFEIDFQTSSDSLINLILLKDGVVQETLTMSPNENTNFNRHTVQIVADEDLEFDQLKMSSTFEDTDYCRVYDIKTKKYTPTGDSADFLVNPNGLFSVYLTPDIYNLKIMEEGQTKIDFNMTITSGYNYYRYIPEQSQSCRVALFSGSGEYLNFYEYHVYVNRSINGEYPDEWMALLENVFYADVGTKVYFMVKDQFNTLIDFVGSSERWVSDFIDLTLKVYQLEIINLMLQKTTIDINSSHQFELGSGRYIQFMLAESLYLIGYNNPNNIYTQFYIYLDSNQVVELNMSRICNLYYTNQKGEYLEFHQFKTYINGTLLLQNVFYATDSEHKGIEIKDRYGISIKNETYVEGTEPYNQISIILTQYSLKVYNQQLAVNHINITRDPNDYPDNPYFWSDGLLPGEIIKFNLFPGNYKINLTNYEGGSSSYYSYTLNGDDVLIIGSNNTIYNVLVNLANVNATIGNQITNVQIDLTNQNSYINNSIINVEINLGNINSTLGNMLVNLDVNINNIANNISALYVFTSNSFINLGNDINLSFINIENNIISINQTISNLIVGISNDIYLINGTISTLITQMGNNLLLMNVSLNTALFDIDTTINEIGSNITNNFILLNNSIYLNNLNINDSRIAVLNNLALINNSISNLIAQVYSSVYLINNSIYTAVVDLGTYLSLMNNTIYGNMSIVLQMNEFLSELYKMTMFSHLLNWTNIGYNTSLIESQIDVWKFINHYLNQSIEVHLKYQNQIEKMVISADNFKDQWLPKYNASYNLWSVKDQKYLDEWKDLDPDNKTVDFGFYKAEVPEIPDFNEELSDWILAFLIIGIIAITLTYGIIRVRKKSEKRRDVREMLTVPTDEDVIKKKKRTNKINKTQYETALK